MPDAALRGDARRARRWRSTRSAPLLVRARRRRARGRSRERTRAILLVDDREENLLALEAVLEPTGCRLVRARSGEEALQGAAAATTSR